MTYVEAKFGLIIRDSKPSETGLREHSDPMYVGVVNSLSAGKGNGSSGPRDGCFKCGGATFSTRLQCKQEHQREVVWQRQTEQVTVQE